MTKNISFPKDFSNKTKGNYCVIEDINLKINPHEFVAIVGEVGSGKSSLVYSMLGEMIQLKGTIKRGKSNVALVPQTPWIINGTVKENIIMFEQINETQFKNVVDICELQQDIDMLPNGVETEIGSRGINLSGGQKQRISLARAIYSNPDIYIIDDCFASLDAQVSQAIYKKAIKGLLSNKTVIFVTNALNLLIDVEHIVVLKNGRIVEEGSFNTLMRKNGEFTTLTQRTSDQVKQHTKDKIAKIGSPKKSETAKEVSFSKGKLITKEEQQIGSVKIRNFGLMMKYGGIAFGIIGLILFISDSVSKILTQWWLSVWSSNKYSKKLSFNLYIYAILAVITGGITILRGIIFTLFVNQLSKKSQMTLFSNILKCPLWWFDVTPIGRMLNRLIKDQDDVDNSLPFQLGNTLRLICLIIAGILFAGSIMPWLFIPIGILLVLCIFIYMHSIQSCRDSKRLSSILKSPIISSFSEIIEGIVPIRVSKNTENFKQKMYFHIDNLSNTYVINRFCQKWCNFRVEILGDLLIGAVALLIAFLNRQYLTSEKVSLVGLAITKVVECVIYLNTGLFALSELEQMMSSFERIIEYIETNPSEHLQKELLPPLGWPQQGAIECNNLHYKYRPELPEVIKGISFIVPPQKKIGVVGRTGSGKSTLTLGLLRIIEPLNDELHSLVIDGVNIEKISLLELRKSIAIIPQDPVLFSGSIKFNIDPFNMQKEEDIAIVLNKINISDIIQKKLIQSDIVNTKVISEPSKNQSLDTQMVQRILNFQVEENGSNFSLGERQLICLARALVKKPKILLMDEATASIDEATDSHIQSIIRDELKSSTVITIAHRIRTILRYDMIMSIHNGKMIEFDTPKALFQNKNSIFCALLRENGETENNDVAAILNSA